MDSNGQLSLGADFYREMFKIIGDKEIKEDLLFSAFLQVAVRSRRILKARHPDTISGWENAISELGFLFDEFLDYTEALAQRNGRDSVVEEAERIIRGRT